MPVIPLRPGPRVLEFFAGVGLARMGLEQAGFETVWANDISPDKAAMYRAQFKDDVMVVGDVNNVSPAALPAADLAWASSPCTDLSLAGNRTGLAGHESSAFYAFTKVLRAIPEHGRPTALVLENVIGLSTSHGGDDLTAAIREFNDLGYSVDILAIDALRFVPQSRPRMFLVGSREPVESDLDEHPLRPGWTEAFFSDPTLRTHRARLEAPPNHLTGGLGSRLEKVPNDDPRWWDVDRVNAFLDSMSEIQRERLEQLRRQRRGYQYRTAYRRTRRGTPVWEMRSDDVSGCLRTARGGSSKQAVVRMGYGKVSIRWMTGAEYATLMGAEKYNIEGFRDSQVQFAFGDAVAVPAVGWLAENYLKPLVKGQFAPATLFGEDLVVG
ncbi:DNA cytosine methyltransferase [Nocardia farcinica]|uniref:DNA cytosine methyltransferase n=1 Tax=Nocardia farcinica TaxID=37329 RepID=UPI001894FF4E|nr:DNA (cytosine-5-)-methyltransferase [Nocardia farcinica]MBF6294255.1 DNA cytosine methyltransferase [Nocardia farcinica]MBF6381237.1 DNA cytosine methyltransferase [Nocardia farcinica]MBF6575381.1 DNA cytosine methyltransferase [Nocardia farcinica]